MGTLKTIARVISDRRVVLIFRLVLGFTLIYASLDKIANPDQFARIVYNYRILPEFLINVFAVTLPWVELVTGLFLIFGVFTESASLLASFLFVVFIIAISINLLRGIDLNCGCFSTDPGGKKEGANLLIRDFIYLYLGIMVFFFNKNFAALSTLFQRKSSSERRMVNS
jgi:uncharacterized membrane protein YphA (DoxX/SURF4 family)